MSLKMAGCEPNVDTFARHYECQFKEKIVIERRMKVKRRLEFGSYNFVPRKKRRPRVSFRLTATSGHSGLNSGFIFVSAPTRK